MAILKRLSREIVSKSFTHKGFYGIVPVYIILEESAGDGDYLPDVPMYERNWIPSWSLGLFNTLWSILTLFFPRPAPLFITGDIE